MKLHSVEHVRLKDSKLKVNFCKELACVDLNFSGDILYMLRCHDYYLYITGSDDCYHFF